MRWSGIKNGELLRNAAQKGFDVFITIDQGLEHEQNRAKLPLAVIVLLVKDNRLKTLEKLVPPLLKSLKGLKPNRITKIESNR